jgi:hypothetical protein
LWPCPCLRSLEGPADDRAGRRGDGRDDNRAALRTPLEPSISYDFPDPTVLSVGGTYYAYCTNSRYEAKILHVPLRTSTSLTGRWSQPGDADAIVPKPFTDTETGRGR